MGSHTSLPPRQRPRHDRLFHPCHRPQVQRIRRLRSPRRRHHPSSRLRSHLRPEFLPPQPQRHGGSPDGVVRQLGAEEVRAGRTAADGREGPQDVLPARGEGAVDLFVHWIRLRGGLGVRKGHCQLVRLRRLCDGGGGLQGQVQRRDAGGHPQYIQPPREQFLDGGLYDESPRHDYPKADTR